MPQPFADRLESRLCFAAGPVVTSQLLVGPDDHITALVIGFSGPLDPAAAQNAENYLFGGSRGSGRNVHKIRPGGLTYNAAANTVTMTMETPFAVTRFKRLKVIIRAERPGGVADPAGNLLDGDRDGEAGGDSDTRFKVARGTSLSVKDADGDRVRLRTTGARGRPMTSLIGPNRNVHQVWVSGQGNVLTGSIRPGKRGAGLTPIGRVVLEDATNTTTLAEPFTVGQTVIDAQVAVDPLVRTL